MAPSRAIRFAMLALFSTTLTSSARADDPVIADRAPEEISSVEPLPSLELGAALGFPLVGNAVIGYWPRQSPMVARLSGMYWGTNRGIEIDLGWRFTILGYEHEYAALTLQSWQTASSFTSWFYIYSQAQTEVFNGLGPSVGYNFDGLSVQLGVVFGRMQSHLNYDAGPSGAGAYDNRYLSVQPVLQIGYSFFL